MGDSPGQGGGRMPQGSWSSLCGRGTAPTAQGTGKSWVPVSTAAQSGHWLQPWLQAGPSVSPSQRSPRARESPAGAKQAQDVQWGFGGGQDLPLKEGKQLHWCPRHLEPSCTSAQRGWCSSPSTPHLQPPAIRRWAQAWAPPRCGTVGLVPLHGARSRISVGCHGAAGHGDAHPAAGMLTPLHADPSLLTLSSPAGHRQHRKSV